MFSMNSLRSIVQITGSSSRPSNLAITILLFLVDSLGGQHGLLIAEGALFVLGKPELRAWPVRNHGLTDDQVLWYEPNLRAAAVQAVIAIVAHHEVLAWRDGDLGFRIVPGRLDVRLFEKPIVDVDLSVHDFDRFARQPNHAFDQVSRRVTGVLQHDDVAALRPMEDIALRVVTRFNER